MVSTTALRPDEQTTNFFNLHFPLNVRQGSNYTVKDARKIEVADLDTNAVSNNIVLVENRTKHLETKYIVAVTQWSGAIG